MIMLDEHKLDHDHDITCSRWLNKINIAHTRYQINIIKKDPTKYNHVKDVK